MIKASLMLDSQAERSVALITFGTFSYFAPYPSDLFISFSRKKIARFSSQLFGLFRLTEAFVCKVWEVGDRRVVERQ